MIFFQSAAHDLAPQQVHDDLVAGRIVLIDVREPAEYAAERIHGALLFPLSGFDPAALPIGDQPVVLHCGSGKRSLTAMAACRRAGVAVRGHLAGGILAWKRAGLPTARLDPATGAFRDRQ